MSLWKWWDDVFSIILLVGGIQARSDRWNSDNSKDNALAQLFKKRGLETRVNLLRSDLRGIFRMVVCWLLFSFLWLNRIKTILGKTFILAHGYRKISVHHCWEDAVVWSSYVHGSVRYKPFTQDKAEKKARTKVNAGFKNPFPGTYFCEINPI